MPIDFPSTGLVTNVTTYTSGSKTWIWTGYSWKAVLSSPAQGIQGNVGPQGLSGSFAGQGIAGPQGIQGIQGLFGPQGIITSATPPASQSVLWMDTTANAQTGPQGTNGPQGIQGISGPQGTQLGVATYVQESAPTGIQGGTRYVWWQKLGSSSYTLWIHDGV
jgi:hypothetical protein